MQHTDGFDLAALVLAQMLLDRAWFRADAPVGLDELGPQAELFRHVLPQRGELTGLHHQDAVTGRKRVHQGRLPGAGAGRGIYDHRPRGLENGFDPFQAPLGKLCEFRAAMIDQRRVHGAQHAVRQRGRSRDLQEMAAHGT